MATHDVEFEAVQATIKTVVRSVSAVFITLIVTIAGCTVSREELEFRHQREMATSGHEQVVESVQSVTGPVIRELWRPSK